MITLWFLLSLFAQPASASTGYEQGVCEAELVFPPVTKAFKGRGLLDTTIPQTGPNVVTAGKLGIFEWVQGTYVVSSLDEARAHMTANPFFYDDTNLPFYLVTGSPADKARLSGVVASWEGKSERERKQESAKLLQELRSQGAKIYYLDKGNLSRQRLVRFAVRLNSEIGKIVGHLASLEKGVQEQMREANRLELQLREEEAILQNLSVALAKNPEKARSANLKFRPNSITLSPPMRKIRSMRFHKTW